MIKDRLDKAINDVNESNKIQLDKILKKKFKDYTLEDYVFLHEQAERVQELEVYVDENSKKHANLNVFLQERDTTSTLGKHVVDAVMRYAQELERQNKHYRDALESISKGPEWVGSLELFARKALEGDPHD